MSKITITKSTDSYGNKVWYASDANGYIGNTQIAKSHNYRELQSRIREYKKSGTIDNRGWLWISEQPKKQRRNLTEDSFSGNWIMMG